jgi:probable F420-dependent oxidoreductase
MTDTSARSKPVRFGCQFAGQSGLGPIEVARQAEAVGFDVFTMGDHVGPEFAPMPTLAAVAQATSTIRLGTFVLNATMRNPVQLAWEASTIDHLSGGRFELGLGAGHTPHEYQATGIDFLPPRERKALLAEQVEVVRGLLDGETVDHDGIHHRLRSAEIEASVQDRLPILVGGNGASLLGHAGAHADIIGLQGLGRTLADGHRHDVRWSPDRVDEQIEQVQRGAGTRFETLELNALVQVVEITDDAAAATDHLVQRVEGLTADDATEIPYALIGTVDEIAAKIERCRQRWGVSYFVVRSLDDFAPVIEAVRSIEPVQ